ncbi:MAG: response regulator [bacterium]|nr:response regulator [bacterium]
MSKKEVDVNTSKKELVRELQVLRKENKTLKNQLSGNKETRDALKNADDKLIFEIRQRKQVEEQLKVLVADVERTNQELQDFAYIVSHDLKAPLRGISSLAKWLAEDYGDALDDGGRQYLTKLLARTKHMHNLIEGILQYSRVGRAKSEPKLLESQGVVTEVINNLAIPENITVNISGVLPKVYCDKMFLIQLFQNLIGNAIKHLGKPEGEISISCSDQGECREFCVKDNGVGIAERHFERIFKIFQTLTPTSSSMDSTGIGLSLVKKITERNGGAVRVESFVGKGSAFYFTIPKDPGSARAVNSYTVLLVDDNEDFVEIEAAVLEREGHKVICANSGKEAFNILKSYKNEIHITLTDVHMPGEDAHERYSKMRALRPEMKIFACTGTDQRDIIDHLEQDGLDGVIRKPFQVEELKRLIHNPIRPLKKKG